MYNNNRLIGGFLGNRFFVAYFVIGTVLSLSAPFSTFLIAGNPVTLSQVIKSLFGSASFLSAVCALVPFVLSISSFRSNRRGDSTALLIIQLLVFILIDVIGMVSDYSTWIETYRYSPYIDLTTLIYFVFTLSSHIGYLLIFLPMLFSVGSHRKRRPPVAFAVIGAVLMLLNQLYIYMSLISSGLSTVTYGNMAFYFIYVLSYDLIGIARVLSVLVAAVMLCIAKRKQKNEQIAETPEILPVQPAYSYNDQLSEQTGIASIPEEYCSRCGSILVPGAQFCHRCGIPLVKNK